MHIEELAALYVCESLDNDFAAGLVANFAAEYRDRSFGKSNELRPRRKRFRNGRLIRIWMAVWPVRLPHVLIAAEGDHSDRSGERLVSSVIERNSDLVRV